MKKTCPDCGGEFRFNVRCLRCRGEGVVDSNIENLYTPIEKRDDTE